MAGPAFTRLPTDERRAQLLELGARLFTEHTYTELSMARIAREAGISKALLYHYFPSKQEFFRATLGQAAEQVQREVEPDPDRPPAEQLHASLDTYLRFVEDHRDAYVKLLHTAYAVPEVRVLVEDQRERTADRIVEALDDATPAARAAVHGWLWAIDGTCLRWLEGPEELDRGQVLGVLLGTLAGALMASGAALPGVDQSADAPPA